MTSEAAIKSLASGRIAVGLCAWLGPAVFGRALRLDRPNDGQTAFVSRLFGARDVALGVGALAARGGARRSWLLAGIACDAADAAAATLAGRTGSFSRAGAASLAFPAVAATTIGAVAMSRDQVKAS
jgi:hypothetical protein